MADRVVYTSAERAARRGVAASASAWGWCWIKADDGTWAMHVSAGIAPRHFRPVGWSKTGKAEARITLEPQYTAYRCLHCGYVDHSLISLTKEASIPPRVTLCVCCKEDVAAIHALELQEAWGIELGWRRPQLGVVFGHGEDESGLSLRIVGRDKTRSWREGKKAGYESDLAWPKVMMVRTKDAHP